jgi:hypothetical protein
MGSMMARATVAVLAVFCAWSQRAMAEDQDSSHSMIDEESPELFLAKATLQQYLSRVVRKDWDGAKRLTHPKALALLTRLKARTGRETHNLAPWADAGTRLESFRFMGARELSAGVIVVATGEDNFHTEEQGVSADDPAVYVLFRHHGSYVIADKKSGAALSDVTIESVRAGYPGWADGSSGMQARRSPTKHRR